jgi:hypothetical protein
MTLSYFVFCYQASQSITKKGAATRRNRWQEGAEWQEGQKPQNGYVDNNVLADECENDPYRSPSEASYSPSALYMQSNHLQWYSYPAGGHDDRQL